MCPWELAWKIKTIQILLNKQYVILKGTLICVVLIVDISVYLYRKRLNAGTVPANKEYAAGTLFLICERFL